MSATTRTTVRYFDGRTESVPSDRVTIAVCPDAHLPHQRARVVTDGVASCSNADHDALALVDVVTEWDEAPATLDDGTGRLVLVSLDLDGATESGWSQGERGGAFRAAYGEPALLDRQVAQGAPLWVRAHAATLSAYVEAYVEADRDAFDQDA